MENWAKADSEMEKWLLGLLNGLMMLSWFFKLTLLPSYSLFIRAFSLLM